MVVVLGIYREQCLFFADVAASKRYLLAHETRLELGDLGSGGLIVCDNQHTRTFTHVIVEFGQYSRAFVVPTENQRIFGVEGIVLTVIKDVAVDPNVGPAVWDNCIVIL